MDFEKNGIENLSDEEVLNVCEQVLEGDESEILTYCVCWRGGRWCQFGGPCYSDKNTSVCSYGCQRIGSYSSWCSTYFNYEPSC